MKKGKLVQAERIRQSKMADWIKRPIFTITPDTFDKNHRDGNIILTAGKPEIVNDGILNLTTNKWKLNLKQSAPQAAIESADYAMLFKIKLNFAPSDLTEDEAELIFGTSVYIIKLSTDSKYYIGFTDGTNAKNVEIAAWNAGDEITFMARVYDDEGTKKHTVTKISSDYTLTDGTTGVYDTTPSTILFATAGTTTEMFKDNSLNICLQYFGLFDYNPVAAEVKVALGS